MEQKNKKEAVQRKLLRFLCAAMIVFAAVCLLWDLAAWIIYAKGGFSFSVNHAASIGIIGGADGPTSVLVMASAASLWQTVLEVMMLIAGILGWRYFRRK